MEWVSVPEAARILGVSDRQARKLAEAGQVRAQRVGGRWVVDAAALEAGRDQLRRPGRPLSAELAWALLVSLSRPAGSGAEAIDSVLEVVHDRRARHRLRVLFGSAGDVGRRRRLLASRGRRRPVWLHPVMEQRLLEDSRVRVSGGPALVEAGVGLSGVPVGRLYVEEAAVPGLFARYRLQDDPAAPLELMVIPASVPEHLLPPAGRPVPLAVAAADLLDSADARERDAGAELLEAAWPVGA